MAEEGGQVDDTAHADIRQYFRFLLQNKPYRLLVLGEIVDQLGQWGNYIATLRLVDSLGGASSSGTLIGLVVVVRNLPSLFFAPISGAVADRYPRIKVLVFINVLSAAIVCGFAIVRSQGMLWLLFVLLTTLFGVDAFFEPARRELTQELVPDRQLPLAATIDATVWSVMAACGASLGGVLVSKFGTTACFLLDGLTYLVAAACYLAAQWQPKDYYNPPHQQQQQQQQQQQLLGQDRQSDTVGHSARSPQPESSGTQSKDEGVDTAAPAKGALQQGKEDLVEGWRYMTAPGNRDVAVLAFIKASGCLLWGSSDVLQVKFSDDSRFQVKDSASTMGILFAAMGVGALLGPIILNRFTPPRPPQLLRSVAAAYGLVAVGFGLMSRAASIFVLAPSVLLRSVGSAAMWVYSTLLLQYRVPNVIQGRVFALEVAFYVSAEAVSGLIGGVLFDRAHLRVGQVSAIMFAGAVTGTVAWAGYAWHYRRVHADEPSRSDSSSDGEYQPLVSAEKDRIHIRRDSNASLV